MILNFLRVIADCSSPTITNQDNLHTAVHFLQRPSLQIFFLFRESIAQANLKERTFNKTFYSFSLFLL